MGVRGPPTIVITAAVDFSLMMFTSTWRCRIRVDDSWSLTQSLVNANLNT
jgi:hypothetical protein